MSRVALQILLYGARRGNMSIYRKHLYQVVSYSVLERSWSLTRSVCWDGRMELYVNIGYIFLTVLPCPAWDACATTGKDSKGASPGCSILTTALPIHKLRDFGMKVDSGHCSRSQGGPNVVTENTPIKTYIFTVKTNGASRDPQ